MRYKTNLDAVKHVAISLLHTHINETKFSPMVVQHPFTSSGFVGISNNGEMELLNILESMESKKKWQEFTIVFWGLFVYLLNRYVNFKIYIGKDGFFYQTNPFNKSYFKYTDIKSASDEMVVYKHGRTGGIGGVDRTYHYYFTIVLKNGEKKKIVFEKNLHEREFEVLKKRISDSK